MRSRGVSGLSLLEVQVSLLLLLLVALYLMSLFASGQRHARRALDYSRATVLAQRRLEEARTVAPTELVSGVRQERDPCQGFTTTLSVSPYEVGLSLVSVEARAPSGALARSYCLMPNPARFSGVASDAFIHKVTWIHGADLMSWDDQTNTATNLGPVGDARLGGALAGRPGSNLLWRGGDSLAPVPFLEKLPTPATWGGPLALPVAVPDNWLSPSRFTGLASDWFGADLVVADAANAGVWVWRGGSWTRARPTNPPLGRPGGAVCDPAMTLVWVADQDYQCLRKLICPAARAAYPVAQLESAGTLGSWHRTRFRPPAQLGMGSPLGLAMDPLGWAVFVHDRARLYRFIDSSQTWELLGDLPPALINESPSGLSTDRFGNQLYLSSQQGSLWKVKAAGSLTPGDFQKLWP
ncbi:hypothetical protein IV102_07040 [bacterium]|nr:hypothetical protein [bacterium]